ncbi:carboxylesterase/lipase family protein [Allosphingosinicella deserti]|uniref:Carboxylic ester hydrolase n=1 Tax=Allosphingosinicella deserti TaxID=2116704 RepID=A0A2P7QP58_9SPHN|nr:carboxylesterase family protein [Sphingomonas deserti]PSJ39728.1 carboxylesterase [Sphingomonas deserti]
MKPKLILAAVASLTAASALAAPLDVAIDSGRIRGISENGVKSWKGIPFAAPPVGPLRWRAPEPVARWAGVKDATAYGHDCMQLPFPSDAAPLGTEPAEDCLVMNVWAPEKAAPGRKLPVIVWIYGGGFVNGGSSPPTYTGANLAKQGVVFVSFNYRLGRFGTFVHPQLTAEAKGGPAGNFGFMDQLAALQWVKRNVASFGGDPGNVTLIGESAGGMSVNTMVTSPMAKGLIHKAVVMSGGDGSARVEGGAAAAQAASLAYSASKGIAAKDPQALDKLRALPATDIVDGLNLEAFFAPRAPPPPYSGPFVDGAIAVEPGQAYRSGNFARIPIMIGATSNDIGGPTGIMVAGARALAGTIAGHQVPAYHYRFSYAAEALGKAGADHASDIPFFFDTQAIKYADKTSARDNGVGRVISAYLVNFAKTGDPNGAGLPKWPLYARATDQMMDFAADGRAVPGKDPLGAQIDAGGK